MTRNLTVGLAFMIHEVAGLPSVHGVVSAPEQHLVFATATAEKTLAMIHHQRPRSPAACSAGSGAYDNECGPQRPPNFRRKMG